VGTYGDSNGFFHPLIEHWNGHHWTASHIAGRSVVDGILYSVTNGVGGVWATGQLSGGGSDRQVVLHLTGKAWRIVTESQVRASGGAAADAYPQAIASSADGLWVGGDYRSGHSGFSTLVEAPAGGTNVHELSTPDPTVQDNYLQAIAPVNGGMNAWAVGDSVPPSTGNANSLIEYGSAGGSWTVIPSPDPSASGNNILDGIFALSSTNVWAVGEFDGQGGMRTLIMHYTGG
jgi:hypothetical protein